MGVKSKVLFSFCLRAKAKPVVFVGASGMWLLCFIPFSDTWIVTSETTPLNHFAQISGTVLMLLPVI